jgi:hypothetical protein
MVEPAAAQARSAFARGNASPRRDIPSSFNIEYLRDSQVLELRDQGQ